MKFLRRFGDGLTVVGVFLLAGSPDLWKALLGAPAGPISIVRHDVSKEGIVRIWIDFEKRRDCKLRDIRFTTRGVPVGYYYRGVSLGSRPPGEWKDVGPWLLTTVDAPGWDVRPFAEADLAALGMFSDHRCRWEYADVTSDQTPIESRDARDFRGGAGDE